MRRSFVALCLLLAFGLLGCGKKRVEPTTGDLSTVLSGMVKGGKGSGVVGGPVSGVEISAQLGDQKLGPVTTDQSGSFTLDALPLFPSGTSNDAASLSKAQTLTVDLRFSKPGFKTQVETVTFPVNRYEEFTFYISGEGE